MVPSTTISKRNGGTKILEQIKAFLLYTIVTILMFLYAVVFYFVCLLYVLILIPIFLYDAFEDYTSSKN